MNMFSGGMRRNGKNWKQAYSGFDQMDISVFLFDTEWIKHQINSDFKSQCFLVNGLMLLNLTFVIEL
jgi:hypothetical protein